MYRHWRGPSALAFIFLAGWAGSSCGAQAARGNHADGNGGTTFEIGALLSLTGSWSSLGVTSEAALTFAVADVNAELEREGDSLRLALTLADTKLDPAMAVSELVRLANHGVRLVIGPQSSAEVAALRAEADRRDVLVVSQGSTAHTLAIAGDNVFRLCPDDVQEGAAIAHLMWHDGIRIVVPITRDDPGNAGLQAAVHQTFTMLGGAVRDLTVYATSETAFAAPVAAVATQAQAAVAAADARSVGVYLTAFDEAAAVFAAAAQTPPLTRVRWYGSDGVASSAALSGNITAATFAAATGFPCPIFGLDAENTSAWTPLQARVQQRTGVRPDAFALSTYDAVRVAARAYQRAGGTGNFAAFKDAFVVEANAFNGVTGPLVLNAAGDRAAGPFDFLAICPVGSSGSWQTAGHFKPAGAAVTYAGCQ